MQTRGMRDPDAARHLPGLGAIVEQSQTMQRLLDRLLETARSEAPSGGAPDATPSRRVTPAPPGSEP